jgi:hypothetical protein
VKPKFWLIEGTPQAKILVWFPILASFLNWAASHFSRPKPNQFEIGLNHNLPNNWFLFFPKYERGWNNETSY